jgi:hypothetical protein
MRSKASASFLKKRSKKLFLCWGMGFGAASAHPSPVMPAKAGIHDFSVNVTKALDPGAAKKSWMPACAGMTRFSAATGTH